MVIIILQQVVVNIFASQVYKKRQKDTVRTVCKGYSNERSYVICKSLKIFKSKSHQLSILYYSNIRFRIDTNKLQIICNYLMFNYSFPT